MSFACVNGARECTGCMACQEGSTYKCPVCGGEIYFDGDLYFDESENLIGCEECITKKDAEDVFEYQESGIYKCPVCGEKLNWDESVYLKENNVLACEHCHSTKTAENFLGGDE
jgi:uncharacterized protein YbaR (Trm112 family)